jgi:flagellin
MTIFFSTNIPEMRAISAFNRTSTDIANIQQRITTGQRINSGKDDPGGLIVREGLRANIKTINAAMQSLQTTAEPLMDTASNGMMQLLEVLNGVSGDATKNGLQGLLATTDTTTEGATKVNAAITDMVALYDSTVGGTTYNGEYLLGSGVSKTYRIGTDAAGTAQNLAVTLPNLKSDNVGTGTGGTITVKLSELDTLDLRVAANWEIARTAVTDAAKTIASELGKLGYKQQIVSQTVNSLDSQLTSITAAEGLISNADIATESSRLARSELLAQNAMNSIMYNRSYAAFTVSSLFG